MKTKRTTGVLIGPMCSWLTRINAHAPTPAAQQSAQELQQLAAPIAL